MLKVYSGLHGTEVPRPSRKEDKDIGRDEEMKPTSLINLSKLGDLLICYEMCVI